MAIASLEAGIAFSNAILGAVHALAHPLGGLYDLHHGLVNAILLPVVVRRNIEHAALSLPRSPTPWESKPAAYRLKRLLWKFPAGSKASSKP